MLVYIVGASCPSQERKQNAKMSGLPLKISLDITWDLVDVAGLEMGYPRS